MHFLVDAQLPPVLCSWLADQGHSAVHVTEVLTGQAPDRDVAEYAERHAMTLMSKDDDFVLRYPPVKYRLIWLRCGNITNNALRVWLGLRWSRIVLRLRDGERLIEVR